MKFFRGAVWWANLPTPVGSAPGHRRPVLIISINSINHSRIGTVLVVALTTNLKFADVPGNVVIEAGTAGLSFDSVVNASQVIAVDKSLLDEQIGEVPATLLWQIENGLRFVQGL